ncbi:MAG: transcriptional regulator [Hyphomicrobium sp.]|nr:transcriptional regulator [Hyphomicrobium sp.]
MTSIFGKRIYTLRKAAGLTLDQLAERASLSKSYLWELENKNPPRPSAEKLASIATVLDVTVDYLLGTDKAETLETAKDRAFFRKYSQMDEAKKEQVRRVLKIISEDE